MSHFQTTKLWFVETLGLAKDALHIYVGLSLFLVAIVGLRWRADGWRPWALVAVAAVGGEVLDMSDTMTAGRPVILAHNWHDVWNTLFWPSVLTILARARLLRLSRG